MTSPAVLDSDREVPAISGLLAAAEEAPANLANNDKLIQLSTHNENDMAADGASIDRMTNDVAGFHFSNGAGTERTTVENPSHCTEKSQAEIHFSTPGRLALSDRKEVSSNQAMPASTSITRRHTNHAEGKKPDMEPTSKMVTINEPVGIYYPPRRPNIFRARAKHVRFPKFDRNPVVSHVVDKSKDAMEDDGDDSSFEGSAEFESESKRRMEKKTRHFMSVGGTAMRLEVESGGFGSGSAN